MSWQDRAGCRGKPLDLFYGPEKESRPDAARRVAKAKKVCESCPVLLECRAYALGRPEKDGIWGALTGDERKSLRRAMRRRELAQGRVAS